MTVVDGPETIAHILRDDNRWDTSNHSGTIETNSGTFDLNTTRPTVMIIQDLKEAVAGSTNNIYIHEISDTFDYTEYHTRKGYDGRIRLAILIRGTTRPDTLARYHEVKRILGGLATSIGQVTLPTGYTNCFNHLWVLGKQDRSDNINNFHMISLDMELVSIRIVLGT